MSDPIYKMKFESPDNAWCGEIGIIAEYDSKNDAGYDLLIPEGSKVSCHKLDPNEQIAIIGNAIRAKGMW